MTILTGPREVNMNQRVLPLLLTLIAVLALIIYLRG
jgi:hypothetical protein